MPWTERQTAMLEAMGYRLWRRERPKNADSAPPLVNAVATPSPGATKGVGQQRVPEKRLAEAPLGRLGKLGQGSQAKEHAPVASGRPPAALPVAEVRAPASGAAPQRAVAKGPLRDMSLVALEAAVRSCEACGLCKTRTQTVFGAGHPRAHWMIVGEAPGEEEDLQGQPFVGRSGKLLDRMLESVQLTREVNSDPAVPSPREVYIANTLKCRPPRNRNPEPTELAQCAPFLARQVELVQPRVILAMGRFAVQSLLKSEEAVGRLRGRVHRYNGVPLVVTYHPSYLLRQPTEKAKAWEDLCLAVDVMEGRA